MFAGRKSVHSCTCDWYHEKRIQPNATYPGSFFMLTLIIVLALFQSVNARSDANYPSISFKFLAPIGSRTKTSGFRAADAT